MLKFIIFQQNIIARNVVVYRFEFLLVFLATLGRSNILPDIFTCGLASYLFRYLVEILL